MLMDERSYGLGLSMNNSLADESGCVGADQDTDRSFDVEGSRSVSPTLVVGAALNGGKAAAAAPSGGDANASTGDTPRSANSRARELVLPTPSPTNTNSSNSSTSSHRLAPQHRHNTSISTISSTYSEWDEGASLKLRPEHALLLGDMPGNETDTSFVS